MKKALIIAVAAMLSMGAMAQASKGLNNDKLKMQKERAEMQKKFYNRDAQKLDFDKLGLRQEGTIPASAMSGAKTGAKTGVDQLPANRWFPGEWEEVQAIVVTFPYNAYPADHMGDGYYTAQMYLPGVGMLYHYTQQGWSYYNGGWGAVDGIPDTIDYMAALQEEVAYYSQFLSNPTYAALAQQYIDEATEYYNSMESFRSVFVNLIDAIQHGTQVWITVWHLSDSTLIKNFMAAAGRPLSNYRFIENYTDNFWYRDCGPICFYYGENDSIGMMNFEYTGRACDDLLPDSIASQTGLPCYTSTLAWEGGNCLVDGYDKLFTSTAALEENTREYGQIYYTGNPSNPVDYSDKTPLTYAQTRDSLNAIFGNTYFMPRLVSDGGTGHIDLYADMYDENQFVFSKFPQAYSNWIDYATASQNIDSLTSMQNFAGVDYYADYIPFPKRDDGSNFASEEEYDSLYTRSYSNHTFINNIIVQPCFSEVVNWQPTAAWDLANMDSLRAAYPGYTIYPIDIRSFDGYGGAIHCITKQIPAESPIRILHSPQRADVNGDVTLNAHITNNTGVASASVMWRVNGGSWNNVNMAAGADSMYNATLPLNGVNGNIDYYITATSNGGKTITKPFTAANGAYYNFNSGVLGIESVNAEKSFGQFYPNPATERADMVIEMGNGKNYSVTIYDLSGREVHASSLKAQGTIIYSVNASRMAAGQYTVVFSNGSERVVRKLIVK